MIISNSLLSHFHMLTLSFNSPKRVLNQASQQPHFIDSKVVEVKRAVPRTDVPNHSRFGGASNYSPNSMGQNSYGQRDSPQHSSPSGFVGDFPLQGPGFDDPIVGNPHSLGLGLDNGSSMGEAEDPLQEQRLRAALETLTLDTEESDFSVPVSNVSTNALEGFSQWNEEQVASWLESKGAHFKQYRSALMLNGVTGEFLPFLNDGGETLRVVIGVQSGLHRAQMLKYIGALISQEIPSASPSPPELPAPASELTSEISSNSEISPASELAPESGAVPISVNSADETSSAPALSLPLGLEGTTADGTQLSPTHLDVENDPIVATDSSVSLFAFQADTLSSSPTPQDAQEEQDVA